MKKLYKRLILTFILIVIIAVIAFTWFMHVEKMKYIKKYMSQVHPVVVSTQKAKLVNWQPKIIAVGTLKASQGIEVSSEINGIVQAIYFKSGENIKAGQQLILIKNKDIQAALSGDQAKLKLATRTYGRYKKLEKQHYVAQTDVDTDRFNVQQAKATYNKDQALYNKTIIRAPFSGRLGIKQIDLGQYITAGQPIVNLQQLKPMLVDFNIPEKYLNELKVGGSVTLTTNAYPNKVFKGKISALGATINAKTRTIHVQAEVSNEKSLLLPGMFAKVEVIVPKIEKMIVIPQTAVTYNPYGNAVYLIKKGKAYSKYVTVGARYGDLVVVLKGLKANDEVVIAGQLKLHNDSPVIVNNKVKQ